jgi:hypothetical protein
MTGASTQGTKTVLHPVSDPATAKAAYAALLASRRRPRSPTTSASRPRASTSGWCRALDRRP